MFSIEKGVHIEQPSLGTFMMINKYSHYPTSTGFYIPGNNGYKYRIGDQQFDNPGTLSSANLAILQYKGEEFTAQVFSVNSYNKTLTIGSNSDNKVRAILYKKDQPIIKADTTVKSIQDITERTPEILKTLFKLYDELYRGTHETEEETARREAFTETGKQVRPEFRHIEEETIDFNIEGNTVQEKFISIVGKVSELTQSINKNTALGDNKEIVESFLKAKAEIEKLTSSVPESVSGFFGKYFSGNKMIQKMIKTTKDIRTENDSIQNNINHLFGIIYSKYEKLVVTGESLQKTKALLIAQVQALEELVTASDEELSKYTSLLDTPMKDIQLNTQIKASVEKYKQRLVKIDSAIMATQTTIIALGKELPAMKTDLIDEMAIGSLLSNVDDYQHMFQEIAELVSGVAKTTSEQTHTVIENLLDMQIKDTHTMDYLAQQAVRGEKFVAMVSDKSQQLSKKITRDAQFIGEIVKGNSIEDVRRNIKLIEK